MTTEPLNLSELDEVYRQQRLNRGQIGAQRCRCGRLAIFGADCERHTPFAAETRINRIPRIADAQSCIRERQPLTDEQIVAAEACTEVGAEDPRNDASLWREWCDFIESALPPGVRLGSMLRGLAWIAVAVCFVGAGIALAVSALPSIGT